MATDKRVWIVHPDLPHAEPTTVLKTTFEKVWEGKGWKVISAEEVSEARKSAREFRNSQSTKSQKETTKSGGSSK